MSITRNASHDQDIFCLSYLGDSLWKYEELLRCIVNVATITLKVDMTHKMKQDTASPTLLPVMWVSICAMNPVLCSCDDQSIFFIEWDVLVAGHADPST